jgi:hypothetical protein
MASKVSRVAHLINESGSPRAMSLAGANVPLLLQCTQLSCPKFYSIILLQPLTAFRPVPESQRI